MYFGSIGYNMKRPAFLVYFVGNDHSDDDSKKFYIMFDSVGH